MIEPETPLFTGFAPPVLPNQKELPSSEVYDYKDKGRTQLVI
jgi:hypothetical protein